MGPRLFSRGKYHARPAHPMRNRCFNGAAAFQPRKVFPGPKLNGNPGLQWGRGFSAAESIRVLIYAGSYRCFNGAAAFQPRKVTSASTGAMSATASMGPRLFSRGKDDKYLHIVQAIEASMGPRLFSRGKLSLPRSPISFTVLQWGRGFSAAESPRAPPQGGVKSKASMGPRLFSRGKYYWLLTEPSTCLTLQWGRGFSAAERFAVFTVCCYPCVLQWGRGFSAAESNRPGTSGRLHWSLQWGRGFSAAESVTIAVILVSH